jgi:hypothetical protein
MAEMNLTAGNIGVLALANAEANANVLSNAAVTVPFIQDLTLDTTAGTQTYNVLNNSAAKTFTTTNTNSITLNMLVDENIFFGDGSNAEQVANVGLLGSSINKDRVYFELSFEGATSGARCVTGSGFISGLAPVLNMDNAVIVSPMTIVIDGQITNTTV